MISAVLLASASASAGRLSNLAESDQRYYAVTSAAQLFCDELDGQEFTIERVHASAVTTRATYIVDEDGTAHNTGSMSWTNPDGVPPAVMPIALTVKTPGNSPEKTEYAESTVSNIEFSTTFLTEAAYRYVFGNDSINQNKSSTALRDLDYNNFISNNTVARNKEWLMSLSVGAVNELTVRVKAVMNDDGTIILTFRNVTGNPFSIQVTLAASVSEDTTENDKTQERYVPDLSHENQYYIDTTTITTTTRTTIVKWTVAEVKKVSE